MKKIFTVVLLIMIAIIGISSLSLNESVNKKYKLGEGVLTIKAPATYVRQGDEKKEDEIKLYNSENGVYINAEILDNDFWSSTDLNARIDEYIKVISSANYDAEIKNVKTEILEENSNLARIQADLVKQTSNRKTIALISANTEANVIVEITGTKSSIEDDIEEIEEIINSIKIKN